MNNTLYNSKGLTFKGAFVVVIFAHVVGICSLYGYSKYKSHQLKLAREEWKNKLEQRDSTQCDWKINSMPSKIVARSHLKIPAEAKPTAGASVLMEKAQELAESFLHKASTEIDSTLKDINKKEKTQVKPQTVSTLFAAKKNPDSKKPEKFVGKISTTSSAVNSIAQPTPAIVQSAPPPKKIVSTVYNYQPAPVVVRSIPPLRKPVTSSYTYQPAPNPPTNQIKSYQIQSEPHLKTHTEFDQETQETVQTFYSY